jgi:hypothetical protein
MPPPSRPRSTCSLCDVTTVPFTACCHIISQFATSQGSINHIITSLPGAAPIHELRISLGDPILARADQLGSTARRDTLVLTKICSPSELQHHYRSSLSHPLYDGAFPSSYGFNPSWPAPPRLHENIFPKFSSNVASHSFRLHPDGPSRGVILHYGVWTAPSSHIRVVAMGYPLDVLCSNTLTDMRSVLPFLAWPLTPTCAIGSWLLCRLPLSSTVLSSVLLPSATLGCFKHVLHCT